MRENFEPLKQRDGRTAKCPFILLKKEMEKMTRGMYDLRLDSENKVLVLILKSLSILFK